MQEEARRMEFEADDSRIFQPVRHLEGEALGSGHPFGIVKSDVALSVTTNSSQEETAFLEFTLSTSSQSQTLYRTLRGSPDSSIYRINATLDLPLNTIRQEWGLQIEARVVNHHGESRSSARKGSDPGRRAISTRFYRSLLEERRKRCIHQRKQIRSAGRLAGGALVCAYCLSLSPSTETEGVTSRQPPSRV